MFSFDYKFDTHVSLYKGHTAVVVSTERVLGDSQVNVVEASESANKRQTLSLPALDSNLFSAQHQ